MLINFRFSNIFSTSSNKWSRISNIVFKSSNIRWRFSNIVKFVLIKVLAVLFHRISLAKFSQNGPSPSHLLLSAPNLLISLRLLLINPMFVLIKSQITSPAGTLTKVRAPIPKQLPHPYPQQIQKPKQTTSLGSVTLFFFVFE